MHRVPYDAPVLGTYAKAREFWESVKPWRGGEDHVRPLGTRRQKQMTISYSERDRSFDTCFGVNHVIFHLDGAVTLIPSYNVGAESFFDSMLYMRGIDVRMRNSWPVFSINNKLYNLIDFTRLAHTAGDLWEIDPATTPPPFVKRTVDRKRARQALAEAGFHDFKAWLTARISLSSSTGLNYLSIDERLQIVRDRSRWEEMIGRNSMLRYGRRFSPEYEVRSVLNRLRNAIYKRAKVWNETTMPHIDASTKSLRDYYRVGRSDT